MANSILERLRAYRALCKVANAVEPQHIQKQADWLDKYTNFQNGAQQRATEFVNRPTFGRFGDAPYAPPVALARGYMKTVNATTSLRDRMAGKIGSWYGDMQNRGKNAIVDQQLTREQHKAQQRTAQPKTPPTQQQAGGTAPKPANPNTTV